MGSDFEELGPELGVGGEISRVRSKLLYPQPRNIAKNSTKDGKEGPGQVVVEVGLSSESNEVVEGGKTRESKTSGTNTLKVETMNKEDINIFKILSMLRIFKKKYQTRTNFK